MRTGLAAAGLAFLLTAAGAAPGAAQDSAARLAAACRAGGGAPAACAEGEAAAVGVQGIIGLMSAPGEEVPGSAGTLGRRLGSMPRVALSVRATVSRARVPDLGAPGDLPSRAASFPVPSLQGSVAVGLLDGWSPLPGIGGIGGLDVLAGGTLVFLPASEGFDGAATVLAVGARLGILRESFDLPGVSISAVRRFSGDVRFGDPASGKASVVLDPSMTSYRLTVGKDLLSVGLLAGVGYDRYGGSAAHQVAGLRSAEVDDLRTSRRLAFAGASLTFLILQVSAEMGWAEGPGTVEGYAGAPFDPSAGTLFGGLTARLTF